MNRLALMLLKNLWRIPAAWLKLRRYSRDPLRYPEPERYQHLQYISRRAVASGNIRLLTSGVENLPQEDGFLFYANHQGMFDILALAATCPRPMGSVFKKELQGIPFIDDLIACTQSLAMDREDARQSLTVMRQVTEQLLQGRNFLIFPEGTRSRTGNTMRDFHGGSFRCAIKAQCPIVPTAFINCYQVLDQKGSAPVTIQVHYLTPIYYEEYKELKSVELAALVKERIQEAIDQKLGA